jgi:hypothetical protein
MTKKILGLLIISSCLNATSWTDFNTIDSELRGGNKNFHLRAGYAYSTWETEEMENFKMDNQGLNVAWVEFIYKDYYSPIFYPKFLLHYEHSFNKEETPNKIFKTKKSVDVDDSYLKILGTFKFDSGIFLNYEYEKFSSVIESLYYNNFFVNEKGYLIPFPINNSLVSETIFRDYAIGLSSLKNFDIYAFYSDYQKPYTIRRYNSENSKQANLLLYPQLTAYGIGFKWYEYIDNFYFLPEIKFGKGKLELTDKIDYRNLKDINGVAYMGAKLKAGFVGEFNKNISFHLMYIGEIREFYETDSDSKSNNINQDTTHKAMVSLQYSF